MQSEVSNYREKVFRYFLQKTENEDLSHDLSQEVFMRVVKHSDQLNSVNDLNAWIFRIARNLLIDHYRRNNSSKEVASMEEEMDTSAPNIDQKEWIESMLECQKSFLERLDTETRFLIQKADIEGISQKELAEDLGMVYATLRSKIQRGRTQLKKMFLKACEMEYDAAGHIASCSYKSSCSSSC